MPTDTGNFDNITKLVLKFSLTKSSKRQVTEWFNQGVFCPERYEKIGKEPRGGQSTGSGDQAIDTGNFDSITKLNLNFPFTKLL